MKRKSIRLCMFFLLILSCTKNINSQINDDDYVLMIEFKKPINQNAENLIKIIQKKLYHSPTQGYFYIGVSVEELKSIFGLELAENTVKGADNDMDDSANYVEIKNTKKLNPKIKPYIKDLYIDYDPKFGVIDDAVEYEVKEEK